MANFVESSVGIQNCVMIMMEICMAFEMMLILLRVTRFEGLKRIILTAKLEIRSPKLFPQTPTIVELTVKISRELDGGLCLIRERECKQWLFTISTETKLHPVVNRP